MIIWRNGVVEELVRVRWAGRQTGNEKHQRCEGFTKVAVSESWGGSHAQREMGGEKGKKGMDLRIGIVLGMLNVII